MIDITSQFIIKLAYIRRLLTAYRSIIDLQKAFINVFCILLVC